VTFVLRRTKARHAFAYALTKALRLVDQQVMSVAMKSRQEDAAIEAVGMTT